MKDILGTKKVLSSETVKEFSHHGEMVYTTVSRNCGQCRIENVDVEIERLNSQETRNGVWEKDFSPNMFVLDEADPNMFNPAQLCEGHCWVIFNFKPSSLEGIIIKQKSKLKF